MSLHFVLVSFYCWDKITTYSGRINRDNLLKGEGGGRKLLGVGVELVESGGAAADGERRERRSH